MWARPWPRGLREPLRAPRKQPGQVGRTLSPLQRPRAPDHLRGRLPVLWPPPCSVATSLIRGHLPAACPPPCSVATGMATTAPPRHRPPLRQSRTRSPRHTTPTLWTLPSGQPRPAPPGNRHQTRKSLTGASRTGFRESPPGSGGKTGAHRDKDRAQLQVPHEQRHEQPFLMSSPTCSYRLGRAPQAHGHSGKASRRRQHL